MEKLKTERVKLTPARAMLITIFSDMNKNGEFASVFAAEKLIYFMQCLGAEDIFKIEYKPYYYGPYSGGKVAHMLYAINGSYIKGMGGMDNRPFDYIWLLDGAEKEAKSFLDEAKDSVRLRDICDKTKAFLQSYYSNYSLELLSSVHYLLKAVPALSADEMQRWSIRKEQLFKRDCLSVAYNYLKTIEI